MEPSAAAVMDATDPLVVALAWALTWAAGKWAPGLRDKYRGALPAVAMVLAVAVRAAAEAGQGQPLTFDTLAHAVAAGGVAVMGHSQLREVQKAIAKPEADGE